MTDSEVEQRQRAAATQRRKRPEQRRRIQGKKEKRDHMNRGERKEQWVDREKE